MQSPESRPVQSALPDHPGDRCERRKAGQRRNAEKRRGTGGKLRSGVWLTLRHPEVANRDCEVCQKYEFEDDGTMTLGRDQRPVTRLPEMPAPCRTDRGCPKGTPEKLKSLTTENSRCYEHYKECRAIGQFPDDPVVKRNAAVIREVEDSVARGREVEFQTTLIQLLVEKR